MGVDMTNAKTFETAVKSLEAIVDKLEKGDTSLDDALKQFEKGIALSRACNTLLSEAEQKVETLLSQANQQDKQAADE